MDIALSLAGVLSALLLGAMSPGPSFVLVARTALMASRTEGLSVALGMGIGAVVFAGMVLLGLQAALTEVPELHLTLQVTGGLYLTYLATRIWRGAKDPLAIPNGGVARRVSARRAFTLGLLTQLSNPKTAVVYGGIFAALLPHNLPLAATASLPFLVFLIEAGWYSTVVLALSAPASQGTYLRSKRHIDRLAGSVMALLGLRLIVEARRSL